MKVVTENWTQAFREMQVNEQVQCPAKNYGVVSTITNRLEVEGLEDNVSYSLRIDRENRVIIVTRTS